MADERASIPAAKLPEAYHHGDLRAALILAAREALKQEPPEAIMLKPLAQKLGVSAPALYRHFKGREALLTAVARDGFERFMATLEAARDDGLAEGGLQRMCAAYVAFGLDNIGVYRLMFSQRSLCTSTSDSDLSMSADASFRLLADQIGLYVGPKHVATSSVAAWATLHGILMLEAEDLFSGPSSEDVTPERVILEMLDGMTHRKRRIEAG